MLVFEDLHWADDDLLDFVDELVDNLDAVPLLLVCTARPSSSFADRAGQGNELPHALSCSALRFRDGTVAPDAARPQCASRRHADQPRPALGGVPLFAEEYARMIEAERWRGDLPETLQGVVAARIDGLAAPQKALPGCGGARQGVLERCTRNARGCRRRSSKGACASSSVRSSSGASDVLPSRAHDSTSSCTRSSARPTARSRARRDREAPAHCRLDRGTPLRPLRRPCRHPRPSSRVCHPVREARRCLSMICVLSR